MIDAEFVGEESGEFAVRVVIEGAQQRVRVAEVVRLSGGQQVQGGPDTELFEGPTDWLDRVDFDPDVLGVQARPGMQHAVSGLLEARCAVRIGFTRAVGSAFTVADAGAVALSVGPGHRV